MRTVAREVHGQRPDHGRGCYIGSHVVHAFRDAGHEVVVIDDLSAGVRANLPAGVAFYEGDIADHALVMKSARDHQIDAALHFAGSILVPESLAVPVKYYRNNTSRSLELVDALVSCGINRFVFSSTAAVYGLPDRVPVSESAPLNPISPYGWSKLFFERQLHDVGAAHGLACGILRNFNVAGADPDDGPQSALAAPCPCCGGRMIVIETFDAGCHPSHTPTITN